MALQPRVGGRWSGTCQIAQSSLMSNIRIIRMRQIGTVAHITMSILLAAHCIRDYCLVIPYLVIEDIMNELITFKFNDASGDNVCVVIRYSDDAVALAISLLTDGDVEVVMHEQALDKLIAALTDARSRI